MSGTEYSYDEQGQFFPYFVLTLSALVTIPTTISLLRKSKQLENTAPRIQTDFKPEHADLIEGQKQKQKRKQRKMKRMIFSASGWLIMAWMVYLIIVTARTIPKIWDPYDVLGISRSASEKQIKSHYRKLSLTMHPDKVKIDEAKNQTIESVNEHWVEITKAFKALTDEEVRNNYLQYGHPDGKQSFSMGIALPKWIVQEGMGKFTLAFYLSLLGIFLPWLVSRWWYGTQKVNKGGILQTSAGKLFREYKDDLDEGSLLAALSSGDEFKEILKGSKADNGLATVEKRILAEDGGVSMPTKDKKKLEEQEEPLRRKTFALLWAYLGRIELDDPALNDEKFEVAPTASLLNENFADISLAFGNMKPLLSSYHVSQHLIQAMVPGSSPLLQLPNFTPKVIQSVQGASARTGMPVQTFMSLSRERRKEKTVGQGLLTEAQLREAENLARQMPYLQVEKAFFKVHGERYVTPNSLVQFVVKARVVPPGSTNIPSVNEKDLQDQEKPVNPNAEEEARVAPPLAHGPYFARDHSPRWHVFLADTKQGRIAVPPFTFATFDKPLFTEDGKPTYAVQTLKMQFGAPPQPGHYTFTMFLICDSYVGLDTKMHVTMIVEDAAKAEEIVEEGEISEPEADSIAGQMKALRSGLKPADEESDSGSNTEGEEEDEDTSETDTETDTDEE